MRAYYKGIRIVYTIILCAFHSNGRGVGGNPTKSVTVVVNEVEVDEVMKSLQESAEAKAVWDSNGDRESEMVGVGEELL